MIFRFAQVWALALLIVPFIPYVWRRWVSPQTATMLYSDVRLFPQQANGYRVRIAKRLPYVRVMVWVLLVIALAQPQTGQSVEVVKGHGIDIAVVVDGSSSMNIEIAPNVTRLDAAKAVIADFVMRRDADRLGLVMFASDAYHQIPLTLDYATFLTMLETVQAVDGQNPSDDGTAIGLGIASAVNMLRKGDALSKVIVLLTDGDNNLGLSPITAGQIGALFGIRVYVVGLSDRDLTHDMIWGADNVIWRNNINVALMRQVASVTGGAYFQADDVDGLQAVYQQIDRLERGEVERVLFYQWQDHAYGFIGVALLFLMVEFVLRETIFRTLP
jgi:Ca-activated chloride channel family protein